MIFGLGKVIKMKNTKKLERDVRKEIIKYLNSRKIYHFRIEDPLLSNYPDMMIIYKGRAIAIELKKDSDTKARDGQLKVLRDIRVYGGAIAEVVSSVEDVKKLIDDVDYMLEGMINNDYED